MLAKYSFFYRCRSGTFLYGTGQTMQCIQIWQALGLQCGPGAVPKDPHAEREGFFDACPKRLVVCSF